MKLLESLPQRTLVRLKCMVADVMEPEFYSAEIAVADAQGTRRSMRVLYEDHLQLPEGCVEVGGPHGVDQTSLLQRVSLMCIPVPGSLLCVSIAAVTCASVLCYFYSQLTSGEASWAVDQYAPANLHAAVAPPPTSARKRGNTLDDNEDVDSSVMADETGSCIDLTRKKSGGSAGGDVAATSSGAPVPKYAGSASAIVNVYHDGEALKVFDTVEFFGVLAVASLDAGVMGDCDEDGFNMAAPPASRVPRFHAITYRRMKTPHPLTSGCICSCVPHVPAATVPSLAAAARSAFIGSLCAALACDTDTATQVLLCIMSNIQERVGGESIGSYSLNLRLPPSSSGSSPHGR